MNSGNTFTEADQNLADIWSAWPHGVLNIRIDRSGHEAEPVCIFCNQMADQMVGHPDNVGRPARDILPEEVYQKICFLRDHPEEGPYDKITLESGRQWLMFQLLRRVENVIVSVQDITKSHEAEQERDELIARLKKSNRELENFAYVASHDLREPTRKIIAFGERLATKYGTTLEGEGRLYLDRMVQAAHRMQLLVDNLLSFSRIGRPDQEFGLVDLGKTCETVLSNLEIQIAKTAAQISFDPLPALQADSTQMEQLFQNLLANALKFHQQDQAPQVAIRCQAGLTTGLPPALRPDRSYIRLEFRDQGIGFEQAEAGRIFQLLERLHGRSEYEGSGIGLAICKKIVENHQGIISAESAPGQGACFTVWLSEIQD